MARLVLARSGETVSRIFLSRALPGHRMRERFDTGFITALSDARFVWTCDLPRRFDFAPCVVEQHYRGVSLAELWRLHNEHLQQSSNGATPVRLDPRTQLWALQNAFVATSVAADLERGVLVARTEADAAADAAVVDAQQAAADSGSRFASAWTELQALQTKPRGRMNGVLLLVISMLAFAGAGALKGSLLTLGIVVGVIFIHERGHPFALRAFKYRELRMFFLPMLGAAVTGKHYNVAGCKKAVVSLLGPVPGIFLGAGFTAYAVGSGHDLAARTAVIFLALNLLNLLPIVPLYGGWFWNSVLVSRHRWLEAAFKIFAACTGLLAAAAGLGKSLALPRHRHPRRHARHHPDRRRLEPAAPPRPSTACQCGRPGPVRDRGNDFRGTRHRFEGQAQPENHGHERAAGLRALECDAAHCARVDRARGVYFISVVVAVVALGFISLFYVAAPKPEAAVVPTKAVKVDARYAGELEHAPAAAANHPTPQRLVLATFRSSEPAGAAYRELAADLAARLELARFGQTVLINAPLRKNSPVPQLVEKLRASGAEVSDNGERRSWSRINLAATAPDVQTAKALAHEFDIWFRMRTDLRPAAPRLIEAQKDAAERAVMRRACETYLKIEQAKTRCAHHASHAPPAATRDLHDVFLAERRPRAREADDRAELRKLMTHEATAPEETWLQDAEEERGAIESRPAP